MFGMGTGGSLRLLSPETCGAGALCCRLSIERPLLQGFGVSAKHLRARSEACLRLAPCTLAVPARSCDAALGPWGSRAPSKLHRDEIPSGPTMAFRPLLETWLPRPPLPPLSYQFFQDQALDRLVSSSSIRYRTSTDDLSTLSSSRGLTLF